MKVGKQTRVGVVIGDKASKTVQVSILRTKKEKILGKIIKIYSKYAAHDQNEEAKLGDVVEIEECSPISRTKKWKVVKIIKKSAVENIELKDELEVLKPVKKETEEKAEGV
ncbi:MAG: 30S ribosomal protein S17 [Candidatus Firestonebacteria bacterium RIFOXYC2_FULL_39_67]|nr:MAG: 30S ribosomal protein S17 [Candidatus Firestonebacteria bacterium RIFOXYD2_FULL_39_29]OGF57484.1 MAG: 30S ribosomal protein S17 [Candidatus Firestonebacteria bacterium RIFOXYC2_FULL_39_67]OGF57524.1 MAG: 30S ribosomal protein S17 [Candidatus Firestonebacteria bacterium RifOxyC12_full_39_7]